MPNPIGQLTLTYKDYSAELTSFGLNLDVVNGLDAFDVENIIAPTAGAYFNLYASLADISNGQLQARSFNVKNRTSNAASSDVTSRREAKWLVIYEDTVTFKPDKIEIPCAKIEVGMAFLPNQDLVDLGQAPWTGANGFVARLEAVARSPEGHIINVLEISAVGRNL
jgi:hypothetical protein